MTQIIMDPMPLAGNPHVVGLAQAELPLVEAEAGDTTAPASLHEQLAADPRSVPAFDKLLVDVVSKANSEFFRFDVTELHELDGPVSRQINMAESSGGVVVEPAIGTESATRKLTVLYLLQETVDGSAQLALPLAGKQKALLPGVVYVWPAFLEAVISGTERLQVYVTHACGPTFR